MFSVHRYQTSDRRPRGPTVYEQTSCVWYKVLACVLMISTARMVDAETTGKAITVAHIRLRRVCSARGYSGLALLPASRV